MCKYINTRKRDTWNPHKVDWTCVISRENETFDKDIAFMLSPTKPFSDEYEFMGREDHGFLFKKPQSLTSIPSKKWVQIASGHDVDIDSILNSPLQKRSIAAHSESVIWVIYQGKSRQKNKEDTIGQLFSVASLVSDYFDKPIVIGGEFFMDITTHQWDVQPTFVESYHSFGVAIFGDIQFTLKNTDSQFEFDLKIK